MVRAAEVMLLRPLEKVVLANRPEVFVVNEGANTLDIARNVIDMHLPRRRLDSGTWG